VYTLQQAILERKLPVRVQAVASRNSGGGGRNGSGGGGRNCNGHNLSVRARLAVTTSVGSVRSGAVRVLSAYILI